MMALFKKLFAGVGTALLATGIMTGVAGTANASGCTPDKVFAVGGVNDGGAGWASARGYHVVQYSGNLNAMEEGIVNLKGAVDAFKRQCSGSRVVVTGYSQGAAIAHVYLTRHGHEIRSNAKAVLFSDPKRPGGEADGLFVLGGVPIAGTDANYGGVNTVSICYLDDIICNRSAPSGWIGYIQGKHGNYHLDARAHLHLSGEVLYW